VDYLLVRPADAEEMTRFLERELARREALSKRKVSNLPEDTGAAS
jgi:hypothetical protein